MQRIPDGSIDCIITDLPYGVLNKQSKGGGWDSIIPFEPLWAQYTRVAKPNAAIILFCQGMFTAQLMISQPKLWRYNLIWDKVNKSGFLNSKKMPMRQHEDIAVFYRELPTYNPQMVKVPPFERSHKRNDLDCKNNGCYGKVKHIDKAVISEEQYPASIIQIKRSKTDLLHPTQKPIDLIAWLVRTYTNEGDTVLDSCMGSGTTAIACIREKRHFIGFETSKEYFDKANKRIQAELSQPSLF